jgi:hypothetical protein
MSQIFHPAADWILKLTVLGVLGGLFVLLVAWHSSLAFQPPVGQPVAQQVPFSHKHHVGEVGLDCRYCHTGVEVSSFAGIPPTTTCMTCHSQLFLSAPMLAPVRDSLAKDRPLVWRRVTFLPDFVFFNHSIHVHKGVGCTTCHGPVDRMQLTWRAEPLTMRWCLDCHRSPEGRLRPLAEVFATDWRPAPDQQALGHALVQRYGIDKGRLSDCSVCHR